MPAVRVPITNVHMGGDYTARLLVGPHQQPMNVILDTGSSALALDGHKYHPRPGHGDRTTHLAQTDSYGDGSSWTGAVIHTRVSIGSGSSRITLRNANVSVAYQESASMFGNADGILGLAYAPLDDAFRMPADTWRHKYSSTQVRSGARCGLTPYLMQLDGEHVTSDIISFLTRRSFVHQGGGPNDPLNAGWMVVGGGAEATDLYTGPLHDVKVVSDDWWSTVLKWVQVGGTEPIAARLKGPQGMSSNSIVDSGTNSLNLSPQVLNAILAKFSEPQRALLTRSIREQQLIAVDDLDLDRWPDIVFALEGTDGSDVPLVVRPADYWQVNTERVGAALAAITEGSPGLAILGLPIMNGYFTIFDGEAAGGKGVIRFATAAG